MPLLQASQNLAFVGLQFGSRKSVVFSIKNADFELQTHQASLEPPGGGSEGAKTWLFSGPQFGSRKPAVFSIKSEDFELQKHQAILEPPGGDSEGAKTWLLSGPNLAVENQSFSVSKMKILSSRRTRPFWSLRGVTRKVPKPGFFSRAPIWQLKAGRFQYQK